MRIIATPLTSGPVTPGLEAISGGYHYQRDPTWTPNDPRYRETAATRTSGNPKPPAETVAQQSRTERTVRYEDCTRVEAQDPPGSREDREGCLVAVPCP